MALNCVSVMEDGRSLIPLPDEEIFMIQSGVQFEYSAGTGYPATSEQHHCNKGILYVTNLRLAYISSNPTQHFHSFNILYKDISNGELVQPWLQANHFKGDVTPVYGGGLRLPGTVKFFFKEGGGYSMIALYKQVLQRNLELEGAPQHLDELPIYEPGQNPQSQPLPPSQPQNDSTNAPSIEIQSSSAGTSQPAYADAPPSYESTLVGSNANSNN